jgi:hypothetical protein
MSGQSHVPVSLILREGIPVPPYPGWAPESVWTMHSCLLGLEPRLYSSYPVAILTELSCILNFGDTLLLKAVLLLHVY